jgi:DNA-directed RNA polymerase specialized sigma subunit
MKKTNLIFKSNEEINAMVLEYQANPSETLYNEIHKAVAPMAEQLAYKHFHDSKGLLKGLNVSVDEFVQCAYIAIFRAVQKYDASKAKSTHFTTSVRQFVEWTINDEIFKKSQNKSTQFNKQALSLDMPLSSNDGTFFDAVEYQFATDIDEVFNAVAKEQEESVDSLGFILTDLAKEFSVNASADDSTIIKTWVATILSITDASTNVKKLVNKALELAMPNYNSDAIRQKKSRAEKRFNKFAQEKGFSSFKLSQF